MTVSDETITHSVTYDGTQHIEVSQSVPSGETWYVEEVTAYSDGSGSNTSVGLNIGIWDDGITPVANTVDNGRGGVQLNVNATKNTASTGAIGAYVSEGEKVLTSTAGNNSQNGAITVVITIRRVL